MIARRAAALSFEADSCEASLAVPQPASRKDMLPSRVPLGIWASRTAHMDREGRCSL